MGQRMFVAITPPDEVREHLADFLAPRVGMTWIDPAQWHLTLAFLASVPEHRIDELVERLETAASRRHTCELALVGAGAFPAAERAAVLWLGLHVDGRDASGRDSLGAAETEVHRLAINARAAATKIGAPPDGQRFVPHLTVARPRRPIEATKWLRVLDSYRGPTWELTEIDLVASYLGEGARRRPRYETVATIALGATVRVSEDAL